MANDEMLAGFKKLIETPTGGAGVVKRACVCEELLTEADHAVARHSGIVNFSECLCGSCKTKFKMFTRVVCLGCKTLQALLPPQKAATGFEFKPSTCVHVEKCRNCAPGTVATPVLEHLRYCREMGKPTNVDADIVQEAERKALQGKEDADKMRAELEPTFAAS